jgi:uncharacterized membrane protein
MKKHLLFISVQAIVISFSLFVYYSCQHDPVGLENQKTICFNNDVSPIIQANCSMSGCHDGKSGELPDLTSYEHIAEITTPGKPHQSNLYLSISKSEQIMPPSPKGPLNIDQRTTIFLWIAQGSKNLICDSTGSITPPPHNDSVCFNLEILPILRSSCAISNCHDNITGASEIILTDYVSLQQSEISNVLQTINNKSMPPSNIAPLSANQIALFNSWYSQGAKNTTCTPATCDSANVTYAATISPIISNYCQGCHSGSSPAFNISLVSYANVQTIAANGLLVNTVMQTNSKPLMPPGSALNQCQKTQIAKWVNAGAPNN